MRDAAASLTDHREFRRWIGLVAATPTQMGSSDPNGVLRPQQRPPDPNKVASNAGVRLAYRHAARGTHRFAGIGQLAFPFASQGTCPKTSADLIPQFHWIRPRICEFGRDDSVRITSVFKAYPKPLVKVGFVIPRTLYIVQDFSLNLNQWKSRRFSENSSQRLSLIQISIVGKLRQLN